MKKIILASALFTLLSGSIFSQDVKKYMGYFEVGAQKGLTSKNNSVTGYKAGFNSLVNEKFLIGLNMLYAFEPKFTDRQHPDHVNNYILPYINFGVRSNVGKNLYITPSIGIGQGNYTLTDFSADEELDLSFSSSSASLDVKKKYTKIKDTQFNVPINMNILYTTKYVGLGINLYLNAGKYTEMGAGLALYFGKVRN